MHLPAYSPELNPIELCWSKLKTLLRSAAARTKEALEDALTAVIEEVTAADAGVVPPLRLVIVQVAGRS